jgi:ABC-type phosphate transport system substrate-binding protein
MRRVHRFLLAAGAALVLAPGGASRLVAQERGYVVIVNETNTVADLTTDEVSLLFLKRAVRWAGGQAASPVDLPERSPVRASFSRDVHGKSTADIKSYWHTVIFSGRGVPPTEAPSEEAVVAFVRATPGAIGYVSAATPLGQGVRTVRVKSS